MIRKAQCQKFARKTRGNVYAPKVMKETVATDARLDTMDSPTASLATAVKLEVFQSVVMGQGNALV